MAFFINTIMSLDTDNLVYVAFKTSAQEERELNTLLNIGFAC